MSEERVVHELRTSAAEPLGTRRAGGLAAGLCACAFVLALASGSVASRIGAPAGLGLSSAVGDAAGVVAGLVLVVGAGLYLWARHAARMGRGAKVMAPLWERLVALGAVLATIALAGPLIHVLAHDLRSRAHRSSSPPASSVTKQTPAAAVQGHITPVELVAVGVGVVLGLVVLYWFFRPPRGHPPEPTETNELDRAVGAGIDDLETEQDPRRAVIKAYARMETALAVDGLPREPSETPLEFLSRALLRLRVSTHAVTRLTSLFERARFSHHEVDEPMRREAIDALSELRAELGG